MGGWINQTVWSGTDDGSASEAGSLPVAWLIVLSAVSLVGTVGNIFIIGAVSLQKRLRVRGNTFLVNMAVADLIVTSYVMPVGLMTSRAAEPPPRGATCAVNGFLVVCACAASIHFTTLVAVERFARICRMRLHRRIFRPRFVVAYVITTWIYAAGWASQGWTGWTTVDYQPEVYLCLFVTSYSRSYSLSATVLCLALPMAAMTFSYVSIFRAVHGSNAAIARHKLRTDGMSKPATSSSPILRHHGRQHHQQQQQQQQRSRDVTLALTLFTIVAVFALLWSAAGLTVVLATAGCHVPDVVRTASAWLALSNSAANSLIYGLLNRNFRRGYAAFFARLLCLGYRKSCCRRAGGRHRPRSTSLAEPTCSSSALSRTTSADVSVIQVHSKRHQTPEETEVNTANGTAASGATLFAHACLVSDQRSRLAKERDRNQKGVIETKI